MIKMKTPSAMKDSGIEWIGEIPEHWGVIPLKSIFNIKSGSTPKSDKFEYWDGDVIWITPADYKTEDIFIREGKRNITKVGLQSCNASIIPPNSLIFSKRAPIGAIVINSVPLCTNQGCLSCINLGDIDIKYYYYSLSILKKYFELYGTGTTFKEISAAVFKNFKIQKPPIEEQRLIAIQLNQICGTLDNTKVDIEKQVEILNEYKKSVITEAVTKGLNKNVEVKDSGVLYVGSIPIYWSFNPIYMYFKQGKLKNKLEQENNLLSLSYGKIVRKDINNNLGLVPESYSTYNIVDSGDIIIRPTDLQNDKRSLRTGYVTEKGIITSAYLDLKPKENINSKYVHYLLHSYDIKKVFYNMGNGVRQGLTFSEFSKLKIPIPPIEEQEEIVAYLDSKCSEIDSIIETKKQQLELLEEYKKSIIYEYVTGKREVSAKPDAQAGDSHNE